MCRRSASSMQTRLRGHSRCSRAKVALVRSNDFSLCPQMIIPMDSFRVCKVFQFFRIASTQTLPEKSAKNFAASTNHARTARSGLRTFDRMVGYCFNNTFRSIGVLLKQLDRMCGMFQSPTQFGPTVASLKRIFTRNSFARETVYGFVSHYYYVAFRVSLSASSQSRLRH